MNKVKPIPKEQTWLPKGASSVGVLIPVIKFLQVAGIPIKTEDREDNNWLKTLKQALYCLYCFSFHIFVLMYTGGILYKMVQTKPFQSEWTIMLYMVVFNATFCMRVLLFLLDYRKGHFFKVINRMRKFEQKYGTNELIKASVRRGCITFFTLVAVVLGNFSTAVYFVITYPDVRESVFLLQDYSVVLSYFLFFTDVLCVLVVFCASLYVLVINYSLLCRELKTLNSAFENLVNISGAPSTSHDNCRLVKSRRIIETIVRHEELSDIIASFSDCNKNFILITFLLAFPIDCLNLYIVLTQQHIEHVHLIGSAILVLSLVSIVPVCLTGVRINAMAHKPVEYVWKIPVSDLSEEATRHLILFATKLTGTSIGYNVYGLFTINGSTVLTIVGTALTYVVVVLQFKGTGRSSEADEVIAT